jgi:molybdopterin converting factor small subunit
MAINTNQTSDSDTSKQFVKVLYFAGARDATTHGESFDFVEVDETPFKLNHLLQKVFELHNKLSIIMETATIAVNKNYIISDSFDHIVLQPNDEIALIPPVSGG